MQVGDRISVDNCHATLSFIGHLDVWGPNVVAYGVEWDDRTRGKNSGEHNGIQYFQTSVEGAGLFLKASNKKICSGVSAMDAIVARYAGEENERVLENKIVFGSKTVESYGFHKLNLILRNFQDLKTVMLDKQNVSIAGDLAEFPMAETLDLSFNLLSSWHELERILTRFPNVKSLNLNGNRFQGLPQLRFPSSLTDLYLASSMVTVEQINHLNLMGIEKLVLAGNNWTSEDAENLRFPLSVNSLDLSFNDLDRLPVNLMLSGVQHLALADNRIDSIDTNLRFVGVASLDLRYTNISTWQPVDALSLVFPNLSNLHLDKCPVFTGISPEQMAIDIIARFGGYENETLPSKLTRLNGSTISPGEIRNAELYLISKVKLGESKLTNEIRWEQLLQKYNILTLLVSVTHTDSRKLNLLVLLEDGEELFSRVFLKNNTVLRLKGIISKKLQTSSLDLELFYYLHNETSGTKQYLHDDIASLQSFLLSDNLKVYVSLEGAH